MSASNFNSADEPKDSEASKSSALEQQQVLLGRSIDTYRGKKFFATILILNLILLYARPQDIIPGLSVVRIPIFLSWFVAIMWMANSSFGIFTPQMKILSAFVIFEGARGFVGKFVIDDLVVNDFWSISVWFDLLTQYLGVVFPIVAFLDSGPAIRKLMKAFTFIGFFLGAFGIMHSGRGPGAFLGDENDLGCALLMFLPFILAVLSEGGPGSGGKIFSAIAAVFCFGGILATFSRGTFVGLVVLGLIFFWRSKRKIMMIASTAFVVLLAVPFAPPGYLAEMQTINNPKDETADFRKHYWNLATRTFLDPHNVVFGVGLKNTPLVWGRYETVEDLRKFPSAAGRATHSIYFQLLPDLGLWGVSIFGSLLLLSLTGNFKVGRKIDKLAQRIKRLDKLLRKSAAESSTEFNSATADSSHEGNAVRKGLSIIRRIEIEAQFIRAVLTGTNVSFAAVLASGAFIDILYYPHVWILFGTSSLLAIYGERVAFLSNSVLAAYEPETPAGS